MSKIELVIAPNLSNKERYWDEIIYTLRQREVKKIATIGYNWFSPAEKDVKKVKNASLDQNLMKDKKESANQYIKILKDFNKSEYREYYEAILKVSGSTTVLTEFNHSTTFKDLPVLKRAFKNRDLLSKSILFSMAEISELLRDGYSLLIDSPEDIFITPDVQSIFIQYIEGLSREYDSRKVYIFTTSPTIIQEVKSKDITLVYGFESTALRTSHPRMETFAEHVGIVSTEIFNTQLEKTGYYKKILNVTDRVSEYDEALRKFNGELGSEGRALLRSMIYHKNETRPR